ncbi:MAG: class E sortase [Chloroflexota bacterium]|nr:class E sortase [Chloroflexota bacterium]
MSRILRILSISLITAGLVILVDVGLTLAWKEPLSSIYGSIKQNAAADDLADLESRFPSQELAARALDEREVAKRVAVLADAFEKEVERGDAIGRILIPRIDLEIVVVEGTDTASLQKGPGHYTLEDTTPELRELGDGSAFPGQGQTIGIAGHRTTYLAPFRKIDEIQPGDEITLRMPYGTFTYEVSKHEIVDPDAVEIVENVGHEQLVLTACHPLYSAAQRYAQFAKLTDVDLTPPGT